MGTTFKATIDKKGIIRLPEQIISQLGLHPGSTLIVEQDEESGVSLRIDNDGLRLINKGGVLVANAEPLVDVDQFIHMQRSERMQHLLGA